MPYLNIWTVTDQCKQSRHAHLNNFAAVWSDDVWKVLKPPFDWECACMIQIAISPYPFSEAEALKAGLPRIDAKTLTAVSCWMG
jgi:hypothetical protein